MRPLRHMKSWLSKYSMRTKLFLSFSSAMVSILLLVMILVNHYIHDRYREQIVRSANQSYEQAFSFLSNYVKTMVYASDLIYYNGDIQRVLTSTDFHGNRNSDVQYREFLQLDQVFSSVELNEQIYLTRIFIPDEILYANHFRHFTGISQLLRRSDYNDYVKRINREKVYFTLPETTVIPGLQRPVELVSMLRPIKSTDGSARPLGIEQVSIKVSEIQSVIEKSNITATGLVYLVDHAGNRVSVSNQARPLFERLAQAKALPAYHEQQNWYTVYLDGNNYLVNQKRIPISDWTLVALIPDEEIREKGRQIGYMVLGFTGIAVCAIFSISYVLSKHYTRRLKKLTGMMRSVQQGDLDMKLDDMKLDDDMGSDEISDLFRSFNYMTGEIKHLMEEQYRSGKAIKSAQLRALQAQINPHFLYNTLDLINWAAMDHNAAEIAEIAQSLAQFYRISLNKGRQIVTVAQELTHVKAYVNIENRHFDGAISLTLDVPENVLSLACINIILQPFVENSIMHSIAKNPAIHECNIHVSATLIDRDLIFSITDDGPGMKDGQIDELLSTDTNGHSHGYGVKNIHSRLRLRYGEQYGVSFESISGIGTTAYIRIPAQTPDEAKEKIQ